MWVTFHSTASGSVAVQLPCYFRCGVRAAHRSALPCPLASGLPMRRLTPLRRVPVRLLRHATAAGQFQLFLAADAAPCAARAAPCTADAASCTAVTLQMQRHALPVQRHALPTQRHALPLQRLSPERNLGSIEGAGALASRHPVGCATSQMRSPRLAASSRRCARLPGNRVAASPRAAAPQMRPRLALPAHCSAIVHAALVAARSVSLAAVTAQCPVCAAPLPRKLSRFNRGSKCARPPAPVGCITSQVRSPQ